MKTQRVRKGYDKKNLDTSVRPQDDFFQYAVGGWLKKHPIPPEKARWGTFYVLRERAAKDLKRIIQDIADCDVDTTKKEDKPYSIKDKEAKQLHDFYCSGIDIKARNKIGIKPIESWLSLVDGITDRASLKNALVQLHHDCFAPLFSVFVGQDDKQSTKYITHFSQNGLTLGERDFYLKKDERSEQIRDAFRAYAAKLFARGGVDAKDTDAAADALLAFETKLARASMTNVDQRDITKVYNKFSIAKLEKLAPAFPWRTLLKEVNLSQATHALIAQPQYIEKATALIETAPIETWKTYLRFHVLDSAAPYLTKGFEDDAFDFYGKVIRGTEKQEPRWKRVLGAVEGGLGDLLGKEYVYRHFPPEAKKHIEHLVRDLIDAYEVRIKALDWMSDATKRKAIKKLHAITPKLGYPKKWRSYGSLKIDPEDFFGNVMRATRHERKREHGRLNKPVDRDEWFMHPHTVNAYYAPNLNDIAFPAAILQPPFFDHNADDALNYGAIGTVIGHEITHGFDDMGCNFDEKGNYKNWWTEEDKKRFDKKARVLVKQFNEYTVHGQPVNGKLTLGENIADLGGLSIAFDAYMRHLEKTGEREVIGGYTPEQRFFLGAALFECGHERKESALTMLLLDPHSPSALRINGPCSNLPEFYEAFDVQEGDALYRKPKDRAKIW